jgi:hypothetical protein
MRASAVTAIEESTSSPTGMDTCSQVLLAAEVRGHALVRMTGEQIAAYRRGPAPLPAGWAPIQPSILRHSDEQTIAAVAAGSEALRRIEADDPGPFEDWGILAAPRFPGRAALVVTLNRFRAEGVWGVTPHLIPHHALHSPSGTLSLVLKSHGPNLGLGGGVHSAAEGLLAALTWLESGIVPGVWLVFTGESPGFRPGLEGKPASSEECHALALALIPGGSERRGEPRIQMAIARDPGAPSPLDPITLARRLDEGRSPFLRAGPHGGHEGSIPPRPHFLPSRRSDSGNWLVAVDATGLRRFALARS